MFISLRSVLIVSSLALLTYSPAPGSLSAAEQAPAAKDTTKILVTVNGHPVTQADLDFATLTRRMAGDLKPTPAKILESLINQRLIQDFLADKKITVPAEILDQSVSRVRALMQKTGNDPDQVLSKMNFTPEKLRAAIELPLAWNIYASSQITPEKIQHYFKEHQEELDGTRIEASHILLKPEDPSNQESVDKTKAQLTDIRKQILEGKLTFTEAAAQYSTAPSKQEGGKLVMSAYRGKMPLILTQNIFPLQEGSISKPFQTPFGIHIARLNKKHPGQFSLEDVRGEIYRSLSRALWEKTIQSLRNSAKIDWKIDRPS
ncbi:Foldase protein PrsA precursor [Gimesia algae]|uniref:Foldase protein PrsA n=2 Tax=Gimesia algae TaxID=2527971 RepID=A0A517VEJ1_9PLAN|nr:Foldase protein PrsA precursor [Gimesia algae]